jgi:O-acetyl-ADP-ribose deacetylase (regulator of RNase III)
MKFAIYHREREYAREMGDPKLTEVEAPTKEATERLTAHLGTTGTRAVPLSSDQPYGAQIQYLTGDATRPVGNGNKIIAHVCNDAGKWGKGFVLAISNRWPQPRDEFLLLHSRRALMLGMVQLVRVEKTIWVANMIAQKGIKAEGGVPPIRYDALLECLKQLGFHAHQSPASIHMPRIRCGLAGGEWDKVEKLICETLPATRVYVYDLPARGI